MSTIKGPSTSATQYDGSALRIAIVHARWNKVVVDALIAGAVDKLKTCGVKEENIVIQSVPGSYELPLACLQVITGSNTHANAQFDAVIAIGVLIKGATMHFEYICDSVSHGLMKVQLDTKVPVIFGVLTALNDDQALERAGLGKRDNKGHNHGEDWGLAAVEMARHSEDWLQGRFK
ncbi:hypothetical protein AMATHDRAFT_428 [Amanita thiersii Skay4041]|uniref:6,7-dimethyl-8-ribityllumazine synthase n=1 Tax=Amanita thiersii Skay4041 TaxID=703135 RepID=A0A2A9NZT3_9AGAR|nr:hypothetical protein AMATHDRAFT_428 [Amanita thiersii Skay4041]